MADLEKARAAKRKLRQLVAESVEIRGIGITKQDGEYAVKLNLSEAPSDPSVIPGEVDGVPIVVVIVGRITKQERRRT